METHLDEAVEAMPENDVGLWQAVIVGTTRVLRLRVRRENLWHLGQQSGRKTDENQNAKRCQVITQSQSEFVLRPRAVVALFLPLLRTTTTPAAGFHWTKVHMLTGLNR